MITFTRDSYLFTTENIAGYINDMDLSNKSVLTLGSSLDQAYNSLLVGADDVTVFDINVNVEIFHKIKRDLILRYPKDYLYNNVLISYPIRESEQLPRPGSVYQYNLYMHSDENYDLLRDKLMYKDRNISFIIGNIFDINDELDGKKYDRIILSNVLQYLDLYCDKKDKFKVLKNMFLKLKDHLSDDGIMQLLYYYNTWVINSNSDYDDYDDGYNLDKVLDVLDIDDNFFVIAKYK